MRFRRQLLVVLLAVVSALAFPTAAHAASIYVSVLGSDSGGDGSATNPYATIQHAVDAAASGGGSVIVGSGTFTGDVNMRTGVSLYGAGATLTTIRGTGSGSVISASSSGPAVISGFTITGGAGTLYGGGINSYGAPLTITNNIITGNYSASRGGGMYLRYAACVVANNVISNNTSRELGGGIHLDENIDNATIANNVIIGNSAIERGGAIYCLASSPLIINNTITANTSNDIGGIYSQNSSTKITNCIVWGNTTRDVYGGTVSYCDIGAASTGADNISVDPGFVGAATGDYHLTGDSYCIDVGTSTDAPATDKDGVTRPQSYGYDMGAYECTSPSPVVITTNAGANGSITPNSPSVPRGSDQTFLISPSVGYHILNVAVDGVDQGAVSSYTFYRVIARGHTISATFAPNTYTLSYAAGPGGSISAGATQSVNHGASGNPVTAIPNLGYKFVNWSDGSTMNPRVDTNVSADTSVAAQFAKVITKASIARTPNRSQVIYTRRSGVARFTLSAVIRGWGARPVAGHYVYLQTSTNGRTWANTYKIRTSSLGKAAKAFKFTTKQVRYYRWYVPAKSQVNLRTYSAVTKVTVR